MFATACLTTRGQRVWISTMMRAGSLTRFDKAYLQALYSLRPNAPAIRLAGAVAQSYEGEN